MTENRERNLDGVYFRVERDGRWENVCFTDLTDEEVDEVLGDKSREWLTGLCKILRGVIREIGEEFDLVGE